MSKSDKLDEKLQDTGITPEIEEDEMPQPKVKTYEQVCVILPKFMDLLSNTIGTLGYNQVIGTPERNYQVNAIFKFIEQKEQKLSIEDMNQVIGLISMAPFNIIAPLMKILETPEGQQTLWKIEEI